MGQSGHRFDYEIITGNGSFLVLNFMDLGGYRLSGVAINAQPVRTKAVLVTLTAVTNISKFLLLVILPEAYSLIIP